MRLALLSIAAAMFFCSTACKADFIIGSVGFNVEIEPVTGLLDGSFHITDLSSKKGRTGFFNDVSFPSATPWGNFDIADFSMVGQPITVSNTDFGAFNGSVISDVIQRLDPLNPTSRVVDRQLTFSGTWLPGTNPKFIGYTDPVISEIKFTLTTTGGHPNAALNGSMVFAAHGQAVPEPGTLVFLTAAGAAVQLRRRLKRKSDASAEESAVA
jgi:hypothetical protein